MDEKKGKENTLRTSHQDKTILWNNRSKANESDASGT